MKSLPRAALPLNIGDFGDQSDQARILSLNKTNYGLITYPGLQIGDFGDQFDPARILQYN